MNSLTKSSTKSAAFQDRTRRFGSYFKAARERSGLSVDQAAYALSIETRMYVDYENGSVAMPLEDVFALTNLLNIAPEDVMNLVHELYTLGAD